MSVPLFSQRINVILDTFKTWRDKLNEFIEILNKTINLVNENFNFKEIITKIVNTNTTNIANLRKRIDSLSKQVVSNNETQNNTLADLTKLSQNNQAQETSAYNKLEQTETTNQNIVDIYLSSFDASLNELTGRIAKAESNTQLIVDLSNGDLSAFNVTNEQLANDINDSTLLYQTNHIDLTNQYNDSANSAEAMKEEYDEKFTLLNANTTSLQTSINQLNYKLDTMKTTVTTLSDTISSNETSVENANTSLENAKNNLESMISQIQTSATSLNSNLTISIAKTVSLKEQNDSNTNKISTFQANLKTPGYITFILEDGYVKMIKG